MDQVYDTCEMCVPYGTATGRDTSWNDIYLLTICTLPILRDREKENLSYCSLVSLKLPGMYGESVFQDTISTSGFLHFQDKIILPVLQGIIIPFYEK